MSNAETRTVRVSAGDRDWVWFTATDDTTGTDYTTASAVVGFGTAATPPAAGITPNGPNDVVQHPDARTIRVGLFVAASAGADGAHVVTPGVEYAWIRVDLAPSSTWVCCGPITFS